MFRENVITNLKSYSLPLSSDQDITFGFAEFTRTPNIIKLSVSVIQYLPFHFTSVVYLYIHTHTLTCILHCDDVHQSEFVGRGDDEGYHGGRYEATTMGGGGYKVYSFSGLGYTHYTTTGVLT